jgi:hypothetical protein
MSEFCLIILYCWCWRILFKNWLLLRWPILSNPRCINIKLHEFLCTLKILVLLYTITKCLRYCWHLSQPCKLVSRAIIFLAIKTFGFSFQLSVLNFHIADCLFSLSLIVGNWVQSLKNRSCHPICWRPVFTRVSFLLLERVWHSNCWGLSSHRRWSETEGS